MNRLSRAACAIALGVASVAGAADDGRTAFRACIDPSNLPFANDKGEGFENRIAALFAGELGLPLSTYSFPQRMNFIRNTLRYRLPGEDYRCDVVLGVPASYDQALPTIPYYRSTYALVYAKGKGLDAVRSGSDFLALPAAVRDRLVIGFYDKSPAGLWVAKHGLEPQAKLYPIMSPNPDQYPGQLVDTELAQGRIDVAIVWGPIAGYFARRVPGLAVVPLKSEPGVKFDYEIAMGVRQGEREWKATLDRLIGANQAKIAAILREYGVPLLDERGELVQ